MKNSISLQIQYISLIEQGDLKSIKNWVNQTNLKNSIYINESEYIKKSEGQAQFYYWDAGAWAIERASALGHKNIISYIMTDAEYHNKPQIYEELDGTNQPLKEALNAEVFEFLVDMGSVKNISYALKHKFTWAQTQEILLELIHSFINNSQILIDGLKADEEENDDGMIEYCQNCQNWVKENIDKVLLYKKLDNDLLAKDEAEHITKI